MKHVNLLTLLAILFFSTTQLIAQSTPESFSYQAVVRDANGKPLSERTIGVRFEIMRSNMNGPLQYAETQQATTNESGLITLEVGAGNTTAGNFSQISWSNGPFFIRVEIDPTGGTNYSLTTTSQLLSVPYALHAKVAESVLGGDVIEFDPHFDASPASEITSADISRLAAYDGNVDRITALEQLEDGKIYVGDASNQAQEVVISGDVTLSNAGEVTVVNDAITTVKISDAAVVTDKLADEAVTTVKITDQAITSQKINDGAVITSKLADDAVTNAKLANNAVQTANIVNENVTTEKLANDAVTNDKLAAGVNAEKIANGNVSSAEFQYLDGVTSPIQTQLNNINATVNDVNTLQDGRVYVGDASNEAQEVALSGDVTMTNTGVMTITNDAVTNAKLADNAVETSNIVNENVTTDKLSNNAVTTAKITNGAVTNDKLDAGIDATKLANGEVSNTEFQYLDGVTSPIQTQLNSLSSSVGDNTSSINTIDNDLSNLTTTVNNLQDDVNDNATDITNLTSDLLSLNTTVSTLQSNVTSLSGRVDDIEDVLDDKQDVLSAGTGIEIVGNTISATGPISYSVGDFAHGGIVFWVDETGQHGLVCTKVDQSASVRWDAGTEGFTRANGDGPLSGKANTSIIIAALVAIGDDGSTYAARVCNELEVTEGGKTYGDWYLPSKDELYIMFQNKGFIDATAFANGGAVLSTSGLYWSSTESFSHLAWAQSFNNGTRYFMNKENTYNVRAVRAF